MSIDVARSPSAARSTKRLLAAVLASALAVTGFTATVTLKDAHALVPRGDRVIDAVAKANRSGRRIGALRFDLNLRIGDGPPVALGELVTHPTGLARLELKTSGGLVERHILLGDQHSAARNARLLVRPRAFLPPLFVLQSNSGTVLDAALTTLGVNPDIIGLAPCGDYDCYVIGDPNRDARKPLIAMPKDKGAVANQAGQDQDPREPRNTNQFRRSNDPPRAPEYFPSLWVDTVDHSVRQIESAEGVKVVLGPYVKFERLSVPNWWTIEEPGKRIVRFEVEGVVEVNAPASAFSKTWLMTPADSNRAPAQPEDTNHPSTKSATTSETPASPAVANKLPPVSRPPPDYFGDEHPDDEPYERRFGSGHNDVDYYEDSDDPAPPGWND